MFYSSPFTETIDPEPNGRLTVNPPSNISSFVLPLPESVSVVPSDLIIETLPLNVNHAFLGPVTLPLPLR